jgi:hypothetical protein
MFKAFTHARVNIFGYSVALSDISLHEDRNSEVGIQGNDIEASQKDVSDKLTEPARAIYRRE